MKTFFLPKLESLPPIKQFIIFIILFGLMSGCDAAQAALYQVLKNELPRLNDPTQEGSSLFALIDYFWNEDWEKLCGHMDAIGTPQGPLINQVGSIASIENMRQRGAPLSSIMAQLEGVAAWNRLGLSTLEKNIIYTLLTTENEIPGSHTLSQKYPLLVSFYLLKKGKLNCFTSSPFIWKLVIDCRQKKAAFSTPLQAIQTSARPSDLLSNPKKTDLTSNLTESFDHFVAFFKDSETIPDPTEFSQLTTKIETAMAAQELAYCANYQKDYYDICLEFWYQVLKCAQSEDPLYNYHNFFSKCSLVLRPFLLKERIYISIAFLAALLRLDPNPVHLFLEQTYGKCYPTLWTRLSELKQSEKIKAVLTTLSRNRKNFDFDPLFLGVYLHYFNDVAKKNAWGHLQQNLLEKLLKVALLGRPLVASETVYILSKEVPIFGLSLATHEDPSSPPLPQQIVALYNTLKYSTFKLFQNLFLNPHVTWKQFKQEVSRFVSASCYSGSNKVDIKQGYDLYHAFWFALLESIQEKLVDPERGYTPFMDKAFYLMGKCKRCDIIYVGVAFITALLRLNPSPIHLFLTKNGFSEELYTHFWKGEQFKDFALQQPPTLNLLQLLYIWDPTQFFSLEWKSQIPENILTLFWNLWNAKASEHERLANQSKLTLLASYYSIKNVNKVSFHPILLIEFLSYCSKKLNAHGNAAFATELLDKAIAAAKRGKPLSAPDTVWIEDQSLLFAETDPCIRLQNLLRDIKALGENWIIKDSDQQKAFIRSQFPKLSEMNVGKLYHFFAIPEHLGCYSSQAHLVELKRDFPKFFDYCQQQQPKNPFIQLIRIQ